jgi:hypothetical protein
MESFESYYYWLQDPAMGFEEQSLLSSVLACWSLAPTLKARVGKGSESLLVNPFNG